MGTKYVLSDKSLFCHTKRLSYKSLFGHTKYFYEISSRVLFDCFSDMIRVKSHFPGM